MEEEREPSSASPSAPRGRHAAHTAAAARSRLGEPGLELFAASLVLVVVVGAAVAVGWGALLFVVALLQVFLARSWVDYLEVPGGVASSLGIVVVAAVADAGVVVAQVTVDRGQLPDDLVQVLPALGLVFLVAVVVQLARRDGRAGALAGLVATSTGGVLAVGLAVWLPLLATADGVTWVVAGVGGCALVGALVGLSGWVRHSAVPSAAPFLPALLGLVAGPVYVLARVVSG